MSESHEPAAQTDLSHITATDSTWNPIAEEDTAASFTHASYKPRTNILTSDTKGIFSHSYSFTPATIINLSLLGCLKEVSCCQIIYNVKEINHFPKSLKVFTESSIKVHITLTMTFFSVCGWYIIPISAWTVKSALIEVSTVMNTSTIIDWAIDIAT